MINIAYRVLQGYGRLQDTTEKKSSFTLTDQENVYRFVLDSDGRYFAKDQLTGSCQFWCTAHYLIVKFINLFGPEEAVRLWKEMRFVALKQLNVPPPSLVDLTWQNYDIFRAILQVYEKIDEQKQDDEWKKKKTEIQTYLSKEPLFYEHPSSEIGPAPQDRKDFFLYPIQEETFTPFFADLKRQYVELDREWTKYDQILNQEKTKMESKITQTLTEPTFLYSNQMHALLNQMYNITLAFIQGMTTWRALWNTNLIFREPGILFELCTFVFLVGKMIQVMHVSLLKHGDLVTSMTFDFKKWTETLAGKREAPLILERYQHMIYLLGKIQYHWLIVGLQFFNNEGSGGKTHCILYLESVKIPEI